MKTILLLRHAKSSWGDGSLRDHDRPLSPRGRRAAPAMGAYVAGEGLTPDLVLCSTATRARQTWEAARAALDADPPVVFLPELYGAPVAGLMAALRSAPETVGLLLIVAHNPGLEGLAAALAGEGNGRAGDLLARKYPSGALAVLELDGDWAEVEPGGCTLERFVRPKDLPGAEGMGL